ncbi:GNAT family N-acetyltransferase [Shewanella sp. AS1]|uniref:GNAT family N-acetyltransferase n=1 Tax=Shewanella sp. AS1 TaxID=2907626 RepID=UPI001F3C0F81|nr:N-acetyltransferase [Shewanella sp. AS1]MCE9678923.1 GNAT family N-acetyltransferase [Shewanella sp. AS1]
MSGEIKRATTEDVQLVAQLFDEHRQFYGQPHDLPLATKFILARLSNQDAVIFLAQDIRGMGLGFCQLYPTFDSISAQPTLTLSDLYVTQHARCVGLGRRLVNCAIDYAKAKQIESMSVTARREHQHARALYHSLGFELKEDFFSYNLDIKRHLK